MPIQSKAPRWSGLAGTYQSVFGFTRFGDLFLTDPTTGYVAYLFTERPELAELDFDTIADFEKKFLPEPGTRQHLLRENDFSTICRRIGTPQGEEVFFPVPYRVIGGSGAPETYEKGNLWVYLDIYAQTVL